MELNLKEKETTKLTDQETIIDYFNYNQQFYNHYQNISVNKIDDLKDDQYLAWLNITGLTDEAKVKEIANKFDVHPLVVEDILNTAQRPKFEVYDDYVFFVIKDFVYDDAAEIIKQKQISIVLGSNFVLSFQEKQSDNFNLIYKKLTEADSQVRNKQSGYLAYRLIDTVVDNYFVILEELGEFIFSLENKLLEDFSQEVLTDLHKLKKEIILFHRLISPLKGLIYSSNFKDSSFFTEENFIYWRDVEDHLSTVLDKIQVFRDIINGMLDTYSSNIDNNLNQAIQVLTIISTIFIPLSFLTGLYGMNFKYMPELEYSYSYPILLGGMIVIAVSMLVYFKKNNWL